MTGIDIVHVPYKGSGPAVTDLIGGQVADDVRQHAVVAAADPGRQAAGAGRDQRQALAGAARRADHRRGGRARLRGDSWFGVLAPAGTPEPIVAKLQAGDRQALQEPGMRQALAELGAEPVGNTPAEFARFIKAEIGKWAKVVHDANIRVK